MRTVRELEAVLVGIVTLETPRLLARFRRGRSASQRDPEPLSLEPRRRPNRGNRHRPLDASVQDDTEQCGAAEAAAALASFTHSLYGLTWHLGDAARGQ